MATISILPTGSPGSADAYCAISGNQQSRGRTAGEALDLLTAQLGEAATGTLVVVQAMRGDPFFSEEQRQRLSFLMQRLRAAREQQVELPSSEQEELKTLIETEFKAAAARSAHLLKSAVE